LSLFWGGGYGLEFGGFFNLNGRFRSKCVSKRSLATVFLLCRQTEDRIVIL